uniref:Uncharacterized protein n=1 Tax=Arundo donax TaxID=35708 RepID=A0A0A9CAU5_ARUDO
MLPFAPLPAIDTTVLVVCTPSEVLSVSELSCSRSTPLQLCLLLECFSADPT